jgi:hypothetical protein
LVGSKVIRRLILCAFPKNFRQFCKKLGLPWQLSAFMPAARVLWDAAEYQRLKIFKAQTSAVAAAFRAGGGGQKLLVT